MTISRQDAEKNITIQTWINFLSGIVFLVPIITLFYQYAGLSLVNIILISNVSTITVWLFELPTSVFADTMWRKKSLVISVACNFLSVLAVFLFPSLVWFIIAAIFAGLYWSFWSGTGQAFLEENLRAIGKEKEFGKKIWYLMALENFAWIITPIFAAGLLKFLGDSGYIVLAGLDVIFAFLLVILTMCLKEQFDIQEKLDSFKKILHKNIAVAKQAIKNVFTNENLKTFLIYRTLSSHVAFFFIVSLPVLVSNGMQEWMGWIITAIAGIAMMITNKYAYILGEKKSYNVAWVLAAIMQAILLIIAWLVLESRILFALVFVVFNFFEWLWMPSWNHVLVEQTNWIALATTRSIIFSVYALYTTLGKQLLSVFPIAYALIGSGLFILLVNAIRWRKILHLKKSN